MLTSRPTAVSTISLVFLAFCPFLIPAASTSGRCPLSNPNPRYVYDHGDKCYEFSFSEKTWLDARSYCHSRGGALANADSWTKQQFLVGVLTDPNKLAYYFPYNGFWLGLHDRGTEGNFVWDRGSGKPEVAMSYSNWYTFEPNNIGGQDCVYMRKGYDFRWVDVSCDGSRRRTYSFACQYDFLPTTTTSTTTTTTTTTTTPTTPVTTPRTTTTTTTTTTQPPTTTTSTTTQRTTTTRRTTASESIIIAETTTSVAPKTRTTTTPPTTPTTTTTTPPSTTRTTTVPTSTTASSSSIGSPTTTVLPTQTATAITSTDNDFDVTTKRLDEDQSVNPPDVNGQSSSNELPKFDRSRAEEPKDTAKQVALPVSIVVIIILIIIIVILILRRRRKKQPELPAYMNNPCYGSEENGDYAICRIQDDGNFYVDVNGEGPSSKLNDESSPELPNVKNTGLAFSNKHYMDGGKAASPPVSPIQEMALPNPLSQQLDEEKFLDEYGLYTHDGYMAPKHVYAEVPDITPPERKTPNQLYNIPANNQPATLDANVYEDIRASQMQPMPYSPPNTDPVYEVPLSARVSNSKPAPQSVVTAASEYDVPKSVVSADTD